jgi:hypothetical protein
VLSTFNEERQQELEQQRKGLALAPLFAKPRPMWYAPAFHGTFGDAYIERTALEGSDSLAWSFVVLNFTMQRMFQQPLLQLPKSVRVKLADSLHVMQQSTAVFKQMQKILKTPNDSQLLNFLRKTKKYLNAVAVGESLVLPGLVEKREMLILFERSSERLFRVVIIQTDPFGGLYHHAASATVAMPEIRYRTCLVLPDVPKKNALDDVFWMALYNMAIRTHAGDTNKFYDILLPFLTGKPLGVF